MAAIVTIENNESAPTQCGKLMFKFLVASAIVSGLLLVMNAASISDVTIGNSIVSVMNATDITNIIIALSSLAGAVLAGIAAIYAARAKMMAEAAKDDIAVVKTETNHMKDELVKVTRLEALQAGRKEGQEAAKEVAEAVAEAVSVVEARRPVESPTPVKIANTPEDRVPVVPPEPKS